MRTFLLTFTAIASFAFAATPPGGKPPPSSPLEDKGRPVAKEPSLTPEETAKAFKLPPGFKVQVEIGRAHV